MAYNILITKNSSPDELFLDHYLGSAQTIQFYWESVGERLGLPILSSLTEIADSEEGFVLVSDKLVQFRDELLILEGYWLKESVNSDLPENFLRYLRVIIAATENAISEGLMLMIG